MFMYFLEYRIQASFKNLYKEENRFVDEYLWKMEVISYYISYDVRTLHFAPPYLC